MARRGSALALDLATTTGFCVGGPGKPPLYGSRRVGRETHGSRFGGLYELLCDLCDVHQPDEIVYESPFVRGVSTTRLAFGLCAIVEMVAHDYRLPVEETDPQSSRKAILGRGTFPANQAKPAVMGWCVRAGFNPPDDNAGDAIVLWHDRMLSRGTHVLRPRTNNLGSTVLVVEP